MIRAFQTSEAGHAEIPLGVGMLFLWVPAANAVPPAGPERNFTARDLFDLEAASDPQISPDGRRIAYVRRSADIMTDRCRRSIWLIDPATGAQRPLVAGAGAISAASGRPTATGSPMSPPRAAARNCSCAGWRPARRRAITGLPDQPPSVAWSPDGRRSLMPCSSPTRARGSARRRRSPKARNGPSRCRSSTGSPIAPTARAI